MVNPKIVIIVLNWNGKFNSEECFNSLNKLEYDNYKVIVVDNGSEDGSTEYLKQKFPGVRFICNSKNYGFAEGNNIGIRIALEEYAEYILLLNNDTVVDSKLLTELLKTAKSREDIAIVSPKIYHFYKKNKLESAGFILNIIQSKTTPVGYGKIDLGQYNSDREISFSSGCAMFINCKYVRADIFDPYYFAYCEDMEFCYKIIKAGHKIYYSHKAKVWHKVSASTGGYKSPLSVYLFTKNRFRFVQKNLSFMKRLFFYFYFLMYFPAFITISLKRENIAVTKSFIKAILSIFLKRFENCDFNFIPYYKTIGINARYMQRTITGIERYVMELIKNLAVIDKKNKYILFFNQHEPIMNIVSNYNFSNYVTKIKTSFKFFRIFWEQFWLAKEIEKNNVSIFHGPSFLTPLSKKSKYVTTIHDLSFFKYPESFTLENKLYFKFFLKRSILNSEIIIADSESTKKDIVHYFNVLPDKIRVIYLGVEENYFPVKDSELLNSIRKKYNLPEKFVLFTGVLSPRKNLEKTLKAFYLLKKKNYPHKFVIVGKKGWLYETIFDLVKSLEIQKDVIFTDYVPEKDLLAFYSLADFLILVSLYEGFGLPILEAMACGCPVVTANVSSMPEVAGDAAILVDPNSVKDISEGMEKCISNKELRKKLVEKGFQRAQMFNWKKTAEKTLKIYEELF